MTIEELNKLIQEELKAYLNENESDALEEEMMEDEDEDIEVTTDEPEEGGEDEALDTLKQIFNMLKPLVEPEEDEPEMDDEEGIDDEGEDEEVDEAIGYPNYKADQVQKVKADATDVNQSLNESVEPTEKETPNTVADRFQKLANIK
jgi:hypothetical protein